jgi:sRNA-binding protein
MDFPNLPADLSGRIEREVEYAARQAERARERAEAARQRAQQKAREAERRIQAKVNARVGRWGMDWSGTIPRPPRPPAPPSEPVSDEERLTILRMLAEKKITAEEAEKLLAALE